MAVSLRDTVKISEFINLSKQDEILPTFMTKVKSVRISTVDKIMAVKNDSLSDVDLLKGGKRLYKLNHSQPSGNPATAILNSMYNSIACRVTFYAERPGNEEFNDYVSMIAYGDDNLLNISSRVSTWYNQESMTRVS